MKYIYYVITVAMIVAISACGGQQEQGGTKFAPQERTSSMSDPVRADAIARKRAELREGLNLDTLLYSHGVKISIVQPLVQGEDITQDIADRISMKMLQIACQNGISGMGTNPGFVLGTEIAQTGRAATSTTPQKMTVKYEMTFKVMNTVTGDVFATATQDLMGVGNSFAEANQNAVKEIQNTPQMQKMLQTASERIVEWYNGNLQAVKNQVERAEKEGNYDLALAILSSVPEQASAAFNWASQKHPETLKGMLHKQAADMLGQMEAQLASSGDEFNPAIAAYFELIPTDSPEHVKAQQIYAEYEKKCNARRAELEAKAARDEQAALEFEKWKAEMNQAKELAQMEADKIKCKYESKANAVSMERAMRAESDSKHKSFWGKLGDRILGGIDFLGDKVGDDWDD